MEALVMAGGKGRRMGSPEENPLVELAGKPMLSYVLEALSGCRSIDKINVALSPDVPRTADFLKNDAKLTLVMTPGSGFIEDMGHALKVLALFEPVLIVAADLPLITSSVIDTVVDAYEKCGKEALSVRVRSDIAPWQPDTVLTDTGSPTVPAGINVVQGAHMDRAQDEHILIINDTALAANVNYRKDLTYCEQLLALRPGKERI